MGQISLQVPQSGLPNSTEDPKVASDLTVIQTLVNGNIDTNNLSAGAAITRSQLAGGTGNLALVTAGTNTSATDGHLYQCTAGSITITLPTPAANVTVGVYAGTSGITGAAPVTVTAGSGNIIGVGLNAASMTLGMFGAFVVLQGNGSNWIIVAGQQDTGWVALTALSGFTLTVGTGYTASARLRGDAVELSGAVKNITGGTPGNSAWASLPASIPTPAQLVGVPAITGASVFVPIYIGPGLTPSNAVWVFGSVPNNGYVSLDGLRYRVS